MESVYTGDGGVLCRRTLCVDMSTIDHRVPSGGTGKETGLRFIDAGLGGVRRPLTALAIMVGGETADIGALPYQAGPT